MFEGIGQKQFFAAKVVDEEPDDQAGDGVDEADGGSLDVFVDIDGAGMEMNVLIKPEKVEDVGEKHDDKGREEGIAESGLQNRDGHQNVVLAVVAIRGGGGKSQTDIDQDRDGSEMDEAFIGPVFASEEPTEQKNMPNETGAHDGKKERGDRAPDTGEKFIGKNERNDDNEIEDAEDELLKTRVLEVRGRPLRE